MNTELKLTENFFNVDKRKQSEKNIISNSIGNTTYAENKKISYTDNEIRNQAKKTLKTKQENLKKLLTDTIGSVGINETFEKTSINDKEMLNDMTFFAHKSHTCRELELLYFGRVTPNKLNESGLDKNYGNDLLLQATNAFVTRRDKNSQNVTLVSMSHRNPHWDAFRGRVISNTAKEHIKINLCSLHADLPQEFESYLNSKGYDTKSDKIKNIINELNSLQTESNRVFGDSRENLKQLIELKTKENIQVIDKNKSKVDAFANTIHEKIQQQEKNVKNLEKLKNQLKNINSSLETIKDKIFTNKEILNKDVKLENFTEVMKEIRTQFSIDAKEGCGMEETVTQLNTLHTTITKEIKSLILFQEKLYNDINDDLTKFNKILNKMGGTQVSINEFKKKKIDFLNVESNYVEELDNIINRLQKGINADGARVAVGKFKRFLSSVFMFWKSPSTFYGGTIGGIVIPIAMYTIGASIACCFAGGLIGALVGIIIGHFIKSQDATLAYSKAELSATHIIENVVHSQEDLDTFLQSKSKQYEIFKQTVNEHDNHLQEIEQSYIHAMLGQERFQTMSKDFIKSFGTMNTKEFQEKIIRNHFSNNQVAATIMSHVVNHGFALDLKSYNTFKKTQKALPKEVFEYIDKYISIKHVDKQNDDFLNGAKIFGTLIMKQEEMAKETAKINDKWKKLITTNIDQIAFIDENLPTTHDNELNQELSKLQAEKRELIENRDDLFKQMLGASVKDSKIRELMQLNKTHSDKDLVNENIAKINAKIKEYSTKISSFKKNLAKITEYKKLHDEYKKEEEIYSSNLAKAKKLNISISQLTPMQEEQITLENVTEMLKAFKEENLKINKSIKAKINKLMDTLSDDLKNELIKLLTSYGSNKSNQTGSTLLHQNIIKRFTDLFLKENINQYLPLIKKLYDANKKDLLKDKKTIDAEYISKQLKSTFKGLSFDSRTIESALQYFDYYIRTKLIIDSLDDKFSKDFNELEEKFFPNAHFNYANGYNEVFQSISLPKFVKSEKKESININFKREENGQLRFQPSIIITNTSDTLIPTTDTKIEKPSLFNLQTILNTIQMADSDNFKSVRDTLIGKFNETNRDKIKDEELIKESFIELFNFIANQANIDGINACYQLPSISSVQYFIRAVILLLQEINYRDKGFIVQKLNNFVATVSDKGVYSKVCKIITSGVAKYSGSDAKELETSYRVKLQEKDICELNKHQEMFETVMSFVNFILPNIENKQLLESVQNAYKHIQFKKLGEKFFEIQQNDMRKVVYYEEHALWQYIVDNQDFACYCAREKIDSNKYPHGKGIQSLPIEIWSKVFPEIEPKNKNQRYTFEEIKQLVSLEKIKAITAIRPQHQLDFERMIASWANELNKETLFKDEDSLRITLNRVSMLLMTINSKNESTDQGKGLTKSDLSQKALQCAINAFKKDLDMYVNEAKTKKLFSYNEIFLMNYVHNLLKLINANSELDTSKDSSIACHVAHQKLQYSTTWGITSQNTANIFNDFKSTETKLDKLYQNLTNNFDSIEDFKHKNNDYNEDFFNHLNTYVSHNTCKELTVSKSNTILNQLKTDQEIHNYAISISFKLVILIKKKHFLTKLNDGKESFVNSELGKIFSDKEISSYIDKLLKDKSDKSTPSMVLIKLLTLVPVLTKKIFLSDHHALQFDFSEINGTKLSKFQLKEVTHRAVNNDLVNGILLQILSTDEILEKSHIYNTFMSSIQTRYIIERLDSITDIKLKQQKIKFVA